MENHVVAVIMVVSRAPDIIPGKNHAAPLPGFPQTVLKAFSHKVAGWHWKNNEADKPGWSLTWDNIPSRDAAAIGMPGVIDPGMRQPAPIKKGGKKNIVRHTSTKNRDRILPDYQTGTDTGFES